MNEDTNKNKVNRAWSKICAMPHLTVGFSFFIKSKKKKTKLQNQHLPGFPLDKK